MTGNHKVKTFIDSKKFHEQLDLPPRLYLSEVALKKNEVVHALPECVGWKVADLASDIETVLPSEPNPYFNNDIVKSFNRTKINKLIYGQEKTITLRKIRFDDVFFVTNGARHAIFRDNIVDKRTSAAIPTCPSLKNLKKETISSCAYCNDQFTRNNICHFVFDRLTRSIIFTQYLKFREEHSYFVDVGPPYCLYARTRVAPASSLLKPRQIYFVKTLHVLSSSVEYGGHPFWFLDDGAFQYIRSRMLPEQRRRSQPKERVYLARFDSERRRLINEAEIARRLEERGFRIVTMSTLAPADQLDLIRNSAVVVAPHGAALTNLIAAGPGTRVIELFNPRKGTVAFAAIAQQVGAKYQALFGSPEPRSGGSTLDWSMDPDAILSAL